MIKPDKPGKAANGASPLRVEMTVTRSYDFDWAKVKRDMPEVVEADLALGRTEEQSMHETFYELCGFDRDEDHIDGSYVKLVEETGETEWPTT